LLQAIYETYGVELPEEAIQLDLPIKQGGKHAFRVDFGERGSVTMSVNVVAE
jgi:hypothetical protein